MLVNDTTVPEIGKQAADAGAGAGWVGTSAGTSTDTTAPTLELAPALVRAPPLALGLAPGRPSPVGPRAGCIMHAASTAANLMRGKRAAARKQKGRPHPAANQAAAAASDGEI